MMMVTTEMSEEHSAAEEGGCSGSWLDTTTAESGGGGEKSKGDADRRRKRFSEEQIKSLESMFETQTKLEPRQKLQLARELGLQPRQVAIWFQNKRARWKSKQLEREYRGLKADYDTLLSSFDSLKKEKQLLLHRLQDLAELIEKTETKRRNRDRDGSNDQEQILRNRPPLKEEPKLELAGCADEEDNKFSYLSGDGRILCAGGGGGQPTTSSLTSSAEQQLCFTTCSWPSDQSCCNSQWWEFWPLSE